MFKKMGLVLVSLLAVAQSAFAGLAAADLTTIQTGISGSDANYFTIGGSILVVLAGIWGFRLVMKLIR